MNVITMNERYVITRPTNEWDMNYRLFDYESNRVYLLDIEDVIETMEDMVEYGGVLFSDLVDLNVDEIIQYAWKIEKIEE